MNQQTSIICDVPVHCAYDEAADVVNLVPHPRNPNKHPDEQIVLLAKVIRHQGWRSPIVVSARSGFIVAGHGRLEAAKLLGVQSVPVDRQEFSTEADEMAHLLADNRIAELADLDSRLVADLLAEVKEAGLDIELGGFTTDDLNEMETRLSISDETTQDADARVELAEELNKEWDVRLGDIWSLGAHRLMCGDSSVAENVEMVTNSGPVRTLIFDPEWDAMPQVIPCETVLAFCDAATLGKIVERYGSMTWLFAWDCVSSWFTPNRPLRRMKLCAWYGDLSKYNSDGWHYGMPDQPKTVTNSRGTYEYVPDPRGKHLSDVFVNPITKLHSESAHSHSKPIDWVCCLIANCSTGDILDPFSGSGTTFVAAQNLQRACYGLELNPLYCAVILDRMRTAFPELEIKRLARA